MFINNSVFHNSEAASYPECPGFTAIDLCNVVCSGINTKSQNGGWFVAEGDSLKLFVQRQSNLRGHVDEALAQ